MKSKKIIISIIVGFILLIIIGGGFVFFFVKDSNSTLTMAEKNWIENNKNNIIDLEVINNYPIFNENGKGLLFDFIIDMEENTGLYFNEISYTYGSEITTDYAFEVVNEIKDNQIEIYYDNLVVVSKNNLKYNNIDEINSISIGVIEGKEEEVETFLNTSLITTYETLAKLIEALDNDAVDSIVLPKTIYLKEILENDFYINYNISELEEILVLNLGDNTKLNTIIKKYCKKWKNNSYEEAFSTYFTEFYFKTNDLGEVEKSKFQDRQYKYGFSSLPAFDKIVNSRLYGINKEVLKGFAKIASIDIKYVSEYDDKETLIEAFNSNKIDLFFNDTSNDEYELDIYDTVSIFNENVVVLSKNENEVVINSIQSLNKYKVAVIKDTLISTLVNNINGEVVEYNSIDKLLSKNKNELIVIDQLTYKAYKNKSLSSYNVIYNFNLEDEYTYTIRDIEDNETFINYFDFYLKFINEIEIQNSIDFKIFTVIDTSNSLLYAIILFILSLIGIIIIKKFNSKEKNVTLKTISKDKKIKYIDMLTSLKNRNFLNDSIEKWDSSEVYPQVIVVIDLNNLAYVNDNFGHEEGDNVIKEAANILIQNQKEKSEIIRTSGNEFLVYLVQYNEKQIITYTKKLKKEFKDLSHGFGAEIGYSMINDGLKTIDDAINEATLDMRSKKNTN